MNYPDDESIHWYPASSVDIPIIDHAALLRMGRHPDPGAVLGRHAHGEGTTIRVFLPGARQVKLFGIDQPLQRVMDTDLFEWQGASDLLSTHYQYQLHWLDAKGIWHVSYDPYSFAPQLSAYDLHLFNEGRHLHVYHVLGAHPRIVEGIPGILFAVWAPHAASVSVAGDFNNWEGRFHPLRRRGEIWELFVPDAVLGMRYRFEILSSKTGELLHKIDPYGRGFERRPATASIIMDDAAYPWRDALWMRQRRKGLHSPLSVYEVHLGSWQRDRSGAYLSYQELARRLVAYVSSLGFTHIELMPVTEHPLDASWGYQPTGYFAPTSRHGTVNDFRYLVDYCHQAGIGVILDWVPGHFPKDAHALARFDGSYLYEYQDPTRGEHRVWGTLVFDYDRHQVKNFLMASACFWLEECHLDGLRVDAVASMLYLDYSRESGEWAPNAFGGNENLEAIAFLRELNEVIHRRYPDVLIIAEESTAWPLVTRPSWMGGLGFDMKWNMGWMHDTLEYLALDPALRRHHHELLTFGLLYAFTENFMLPLSHDEVVHGKGSLLARMPGDRTQRFANLRLLYVYMWTYPGKKFLFMGNEFAQTREWDYNATLDWDLLRLPEHRGIQKLLCDLNTLYRSIDSLHDQEFNQDSFEWLDCRDITRSIVVYLRRSSVDGRFVIMILNFAAVGCTDYRVGVPAPGFYRKALNSDARCYGGSGYSDMTRDRILAVPVFHMGQEYSLVVDLPPLTAIVLIPAHSLSETN